MGGSDYPADENALHEPQNKEQDRRRDSRLLDCWQSPEKSRDDTGAGYRNDHGAFAAMPVGIRAEQSRTHRPHEERHGEGGIDARKRERRILGREEQLAQDGRDIEKDEKIEEIECPTKRRCQYCGQQRCIGPRRFASDLIFYR
jgi:hypothetical protein